MRSLGHSRGFPLQHGLNACLKKPRMLASECIKKYGRRIHWELKRLMWTKKNELGNVDQKTLIRGI